MASQPRRKNAPASHQIKRSITASPSCLPACVRRHRRRRRHLSPHSSDFHLFLHIINVLLPLSQQMFQRQVRRGQIPEELLLCRISRCLRVARRTPPQGPPQGPPRGLPGVLMALPVCSLRRPGAIIYCYEMVHFLGCPQEYGLHYNVRPYQHQNLIVTGTLSCW